MLKRPPARRRSSPSSSGDDGRRERKRDEMKRWRQNQREGKRIALTPYDAATVNFLIAMNWLDPTEADDKRAIGEAMSAMISDAVRR